jgi:Mg2+ and Co2+ transporter CorA
MAADGHLLLVLHAPPQPGEKSRRGRYFWRPPDGAWKSSAPDGVSLGLRTHLDEFDAALDALEPRLQAAARADEWFEILQAAAPLHRTLRHLHETLQDARESVPDDRDLINLRDRAGDLDRRAEQIHGDARTGLELTAARQGEEQARRTYEMSVATYRLNLLAAIFLPVATLASLFGMNIPHGPELPQSPFFWMLLGGGLLFGLLLATVVSRRPIPPPGPASAVKQARKRLPS